MDQLGVYVALDGSFDANKTVLFGVLQHSRAVQMRMLACMLSIGFDPADIL
jgi:hypothetical protein